METVIKSETSGKEEREESQREAKVCLLFRLRSSQPSSRFHHKYNNKYHQTLQRSCCSLHLLSPIETLQTAAVIFPSLPAEQFHEVLETVLSQEVEGSLRRPEVDEQEDEEDDGQQGDQQVPAGRQDVVPLGFIGALLGQLEVPLSLLVPGLDGVDERHEPQAAEVHVQGVAQRPDQVVFGRTLPNVAHVDHGGPGWFPGGLAVGERGAV